MRRTTGPRIAHAARPLNSSHSGSPARRPPKHRPIRYNESSTMNNPKVLENTQVMVVDDNADTCDLLRVVLEQAGATVVVAQSVDSAVDAFRKNPSHAVIADIRLGNADGYD